MKPAGMTKQKVYQRANIKHMKTQNLKLDNILNPISQATVSVQTDEEEFFNYIFNFLTYLDQRLQ